MLKRNIMEKTRKKSKGQSTVEYIILVAAVIAALIIFLPGTFRATYDAALNDSVAGVNDMSNRMSRSRPVAP